MSEETTTKLKTQPQKVLKQPIMKILKLQQPQMKLRDNLINPKVPKMKTINYYIKYSTK